MKRLLVALTLVGLVGLSTGLGMAQNQKKQDSPVEGTAWLVGHAHIDLSWLWPRSETLHEVCPLTFRSVMRLMDQYPDFIFAQSTAQVYRWMERYYPEDFKRIAEKIKSGQWEVVGGSWDEHNTNIPCGESLVRQYLYAKRYFMDHFGVDVQVGWLPDVFGFNWNMPQIYNKVGIKYFMTHKLKHQIRRNNPPIPFPYHLFWWEAPDGSKVLAYHTVGGYGESIHGDQILKELKTLKKMHGVSDLLVIYGKGDHGGGPLPDMLQRAHELQKRTDFPKVVFTKALDYFKHLESLPVANTLPTMDDELYVKTHRGTLTTDAQVKRDNRRCEELLLDIERFAVQASELGATYPRKELNDLWEKLLYGQVHDNIDGSSIKYVYFDAATDYTDIKLEGGKLLNNALGTIARQVDTRGPGDVALMVFNPLAWSRTDVVKIDLTKLGGPARVLTRSGAEVPAQIVEEDGKQELIFLAEDVPGVGYKTYFLQKGVKPSAVKTDLVVRGLVLENGKLRVEVDRASGFVRSVYDKRQKRETLAKGAMGNLLEVFEDRPPNAPGGEPAWNIYLGARTLLDKPESVELVESGPVRARIRITKKYDKSTFWQDVILYAGSDKVDFEFRADWHEHYKFAKVAFPLAAKNDYATYEIPYAVIQRFSHLIKQPVKTKLEFPPRAWEPADQLKFEVAALRWTDLTDRSGKFGATLLNDSKYGHSLAGDTLRISLVRGARRGYPRTPEMWTDQSDEPIVGIHHVRYALVPHKGDWREGKAVRRGYNFNYALLPLCEKKHEGELAPEHGLVDVEPSDVIVGAVKRAEDNDDVIVRLVEMGGRPAKARLKLAKAPDAVSETDLMEWDRFVPTTAYKVMGDEVTVTLKPFEIKTLRLKY